MSDERTDMQQHAETYCQRNGLDLRLCDQMPTGYETANGMYDPEIRTVFINCARLKSAPLHEKLFYLYHELRHAAQYLKPERFERRIVKSLDYVIGYNGICWKKKNGQWKKCKLDVSEDDFTQMYLAQPNEMDANTFACETVAGLLGNSEVLQALYAAWMPTEKVSDEQFEKLYAQIDQLTE